MDRQSPETSSTTPTVFRPLSAAESRRPICCHLAIRAYYCRRSRSGPPDSPADRRRWRCQNDHSAVIWIVPDGGGDGTRLASRSFYRPAGRTNGPLWLWSNFFIGHLTSACWRHNNWRRLSSGRDGSVRSFSGRNRHALCCRHRATSVVVVVVIGFDRG